MTSKNWLWFAGIICFCQPCVARIPFWQTMPDKRIASTPIRTETTDTAENCQQLCIDAANMEGCLSVNFNMVNQRCELIAATAMDIDPVAEVGTNYKEYCTMLVAGGKYFFTGKQFACQQNTKLPHIPGPSTSPSAWEHTTGNIQTRYHFIGITYRWVSARKT